MSAHEHQGGHVAWYNAIQRAVPHSEAFWVRLALERVEGAPEVVAAAWALGQHAAVRGAVLLLLEGTDLGERVATAYESLRRTDPQDIRVAT